MSKNPAEFFLVYRPKSLKGLWSPIQGAEGFTSKEAAEKAISSFQKILGKAFEIQVRVFDINIKNPLNRREAFALLKEGSRNLQESRKGRTPESELYLRGWGGANLNTVMRFGASKKIKDLASRVSLRAHHGISLAGRGKGSPLGKNPHDIDFDWDYEQKKIEKLHHGKKIYWLSVKDHRGQSAPGDQHGPFLTIAKAKARIKAVVGRSHRVAIFSTGAAGGAGKIVWRRKNPSEDRLMARWETVPFRLQFFVANNAWAVTWGKQMIQLSGDPMFFQSKNEARAAIIRHDLVLGPKGIITSKTGKNPLTDKEAAAILRQARDDHKYGQRFVSGSFTRSFSTGEARGKTQVVAGYAESKKAKRIAAKVFRGIRATNPHGLTPIYAHTEKIWMKKGPKSNYPGQRFVHTFKPGVRQLGIPAGAIIFNSEADLKAGRGTRIKTRSVLLDGPKHLWGRFKA